MNAREFAEDVVEKLNAAGFQAYWAGGCVRDHLLGIQPSDFDIATSAHPEQIRRLFGNHRTLPVGAAFGVIIVLGPDRKTQVEVATFRSDAAYSDGRRPDYVTFSTPQLDALRRDFTINGMFYDPLTKSVIDFVGGQADLQRRVVRAIGNAWDRIREDKLRMLRAVRIAARFEFEIEDETYQVICNHSSEASSVSGERLWVELQKTLDTAAAAWAVRTWADTGLLRVLLPEVADAWNRQGCAERTLRMLGCPSHISWLGRLGGLLWSAVGDKRHETVSRLKDRLRFSNDQEAALRFALASQEALSVAEQSNWSQVQPWLISPWIKTAIELLAQRIEIGQASQSTLDWLSERLDWPASNLDPPPLLNGQDLIEAGYPASPLFKDWLFQVRCHQLDGNLTTKEQALQFLQSQ